MAEPDGLKFDLGKDNLRCLFVCMFVLLTFLIQHGWTDGLKYDRGMDFFHQYSGSIYSTDKRKYKGIFL